MGPCYHIPGIVCDNCRDAGPTRSPSPYDSWGFVYALEHRVNRLADRVTALEKAAEPTVPDLLRCPFCGGPPVVHTSDANDVKCASCAMGWVLRSVWQRRAQ